MTNLLLQHSGIGLKHPHYFEIINNKPDIGWLEIHAENFFNNINHNILDEITKTYPLSIHGVGLSLGSAEELDKLHLKNLKDLVDKYNPILVSEHIAWGKIDGIYLNDLLPLPYSYEALNIITNHIKETQDYLGRQILVENPSTYLEFNNSEMAEWDFVNKVANKSGCGVLLDINNIYVTCKNHNYDPIHYINAISPEFIKEIHLAGHSTQYINNHPILIDNHGDIIANEVWELYDYTINKIGKIPTLIEWDTNIPELNILLQEARKAEKILLK